MRGRAHLLFTLLLAAAPGCADADPPPAPAECLRTPAMHSAGEMRIAGSGANLAPVTRVASVFEKRHAGEHVRVAQSIGTGGAIRALADGVIDIGLASRALTAEEQTRGVEAHAFGHVALSPTIHQHVPVTAITTGELAAIYRGETTSWPDGTAIVPILRQPGDSTMRAIETSSPELENAMRAARESGRALTRYTDQEVRDTLLAVPGAIGFLDAGTVALEEAPLRSLPLDGIAPTAETARANTYPFVLTLSLLTRTDAPEAARAFVELMTSAEVAELLAPYGYAPVTPPSEGGP